MVRKYQNKKSLFTNYLKNVNIKYMVKTEKIINSVESINMLLTMKLPAQLAFKLALLAKKIEPIVETYNKVRIEKIKELGEMEKDENGKDTDSYKFTDENRVKFAEEIQGLLSSENEIDVPEIKSEDLGNETIEPKYLMPLDWLFKA